MKQVDKENDGRYPYTYSADLIRMIVGYDEHGTILSRSDASNLKSKIAEIIGMDERELACKLADYFLENEEDISNNATKDFLRVKGW